jgi:hypothetical protein
MNAHHTTLLLALLLSMTVACGPDDDSNNATSPDTPIQAPDTYSFESRFKDDASSVSYSGQTARHALIAGLNDYIGTSLQDDAISNTSFGDKDDFLAALTFYYEFDSDSNSDLAHRLTPSEGLTITPTTYVGISSGKDLKGKFAGNDSVTDHKDWNTQFQGWEGQTSAEGLLLALMDQLAGQAYALSQGNAPLDPVDGAMLSVYVTPEGVDLKQMIQKLLLMGIGFSQAADDYLDDDLDDKGLLAGNTQVEDNAYSGLEHAWDEGFGYFGAARNYASYSDAQLSDQIQLDADGDGVITLTSEYNFGASINAGKRDAGSSDAAKTDYTKLIFDGFVQGRTLIVNAGDEVDADELAAIKTQRDAAILNWEKAIAATVVHYINDTLQEMQKHSAATGDYSHAQHAKVWSELKGFALGFQFNPRSPMNQGSSFADFHALVGNAPVLPSAEATAFEQYKADLIAARAILKTAYDFDAANMGDAQGEGGW